jgi:carbohydrate-binding DOMON domain-containing protein
MQLSPFPRHLIPLRSKYSPQHPILKQPQPAFLPQCERPSLKKKKKIKLLNVTTPNYTSQQVQIHTAATTKTTTTMTTTTTTTKTKPTITTTPHSYEPPMLHLCSRKCKQLPIYNMGGLSLCGVAVAAVWACMCWYV